MSQVQLKGELSRKDDAQMSFSCEVQYISFHKMQQACKHRESISWQVRIATMLRTYIHVRTYIHTCTYIHVCMHLKDLSQLEATAGYPGCLGVHFVDIR